MEMNCTDKRCPIHGQLALRGRTFKGEVVSTGMAKSVVVEIDRTIKNPKFHRFKRQTSRIPAHLPECMEVKKGDKVEISECRKLSKTKSFVVTEVMKDGS